MNNFSSLTRLAAFVELKDWRGPTKKECVRYVRKLGEHFQCDPATLSQDQVRAYVSLFAPTEKVRRLDHEASPLFPPRVLP